MWAPSPEYVPDQEVASIKDKWRGGDHFISSAGVLADDFDANGTVDFLRSDKTTLILGPRHAFLSRRGFPDRLSQYDNGRWGTIQFIYDSPQRLEDLGAGGAVGARQR